MRNVIHIGNLSAASIDEISEVIAQRSEALQVSAREILKLRLSAEEVLGIWAQELGEDTPCQLLENKRLGKTTFLLCADGKSVDPTRYRDDLMLSVSNTPNMTAALGLPAEYQYFGGRNELKLHLPGKKINAVKVFLYAILAAVITGFALRWLAPGSTDIVSGQILSPLMNTITNILHLIAGPLVFLSIVSGITGVGDAASFGRIGGTLTKRFLIMTYIVAVALWLSVVWLFPITFAAGSGGEQSFSGILQMILDIIPGDIVSPFQTGNAMQIIFIAASLGLGCVLLNDSVSGAVKVINQINSVVQLLMAQVSRLLSFFVFLCITNLILISDITVIYQLLIPLLLVTAMSLVLPLVYGLVAAIRTGVPYGKLLRGQMPTYLLALGTASSAAAFGSNCECCEKKLHIDQRLIHFGVPFGQVLFKLGSLTTLLTLSLFMAGEYNIPMTPKWVLTLLLIAPILAVATPPIPGGGISATLILFAQLGIPTECMALCATILTFTDYTVTACSVSCLQQELLVSAKKLNMLGEPEDAAERTH